MLFCQLLNQLYKFQYSYKFYYIKRKTYFKNNSAKSFIISYKDQTKGQITIKKDSQLIILKNKIIMKIDNQIYYEPRSLSINTKEQSQKIIKNDISTSSNSKSSNYFIYDEGYDRKNLKNLLYEEYNNKIKLNRQKRQTQKNLKIQQQKADLRKIALIQQELQQSNSRRKIHNQLIAQNDYQQSLQNKKVMKYEIKEKNQKQIQINNSKKQDFSKNTFFKEFYNNHIQESNKIAQRYLEEVYPQQKQRQVRKSHLIDTRAEESLLRYKYFDQAKRQQDNKKKEEYKNELRRQISQKQVMKRNYSQGRKLDLVERQLQINHYNPITNPFSLGINPQNKYIVNQIRRSIQQKAASGNNIQENSPLKTKNLSQLARQGSQTLL